MNSTAPSWALPLWTSVEASHGDKSSVIIMHHLNLPTAQDLVRFFKVGVALADEQSAWKGEWESWLARGWMHIAVSVFSGTWKITSGRRCGFSCCTIELQCWCSSIQVCWVMFIGTWGRVTQWDRFQQLYSVLLYTLYHTGILVCKPWQVYIYICVCVLKVRFKVVSVVN